MRGWQEVLKEFPKFAQNWNLCDEIKKIEFDKDRRPILKDGVCLLQETHTYFVFKCCIPEYRITFEWTVEK